MTLPSRGAGVAASADHAATIGSFVFSLDTELGWGDLWNQPHLEQSSRDGAVERTNIGRLLDLMDEYGIVATWAITGHLFHETCEECATCPIAELNGTDRRFERIWRTNDPMWYGPDVIESLLARGTRHEIGFHGYTHRTFDRLNADEAEYEIHQWLRLGARKGIAPTTVIFPQGRINWLPLFRHGGFLCYRGAEVKHPLLSFPLLGKIVNKINLKLAFLTPQVFEPSIDSLGLVNIPGSLWLFRTNRQVERVLDFLHLHTLRLRPAARSIVRAAEEKKVIHLWIHPQELRTEKDFAKIRFVFERFAREAKAGRLRSITMEGLARERLAMEMRSDAGSPRAVEAR